MDDLYEQWGCGMSAPRGWSNYDASPTLRFERLPLLGRLFTKNDTRFPENVLFGDIVAGLPVSTNSCRGIYCAHVLEHLCLEDARTALRNTYSYLTPGGIFRLVVPDLEQMARNYLSSRDERAAHRFVKNTDLGHIGMPSGFKGYVVDLFGNGSHKWMWDHKSVTAELSDAGFRDIRKASCGDSEDSRFVEIEHEARFEGCVAIQCRK